MAQSLVKHNCGALLGPETSDSCRRLKPRSSEFSMGKSRVRGCILTHSHF